nr:MAG TPA: hypothetical protein [Caudoviricetes sp.]
MRASILSLGIHRMELNMMTKQKAIIKNPM